MNQPKKNIVVSGLDVDFVERLSDKGLNVHFFTVTDKINFAKACLNADAVFLRWDGSQGRAIQLLELIKTTFKDSEKKAPPVYLTTSLSQKNDRALKGNSERFKVVGAFVLPEEMHRIDMMLFDLSGEIEGDSGAKFIRRSEFRAKSKIELSALILKSKEAFEQRQSGVKKELSVFFYAQSPETAAAGIANLSALGVQHPRSFSDIDLLLVRLAEGAPDVLMIYHAQNPEVTRLLLERVAFERKYSPGRIMILCPGPAATADFISLNANSWIDAKIECPFNKSGFKLALAELERVENEAPNARAGLIGLRKLIQETTPRDAAGNNQTVWNKILGLAKLPEGKYWAKLEHLYFCLASGNSEKALDEANELLLMNTNRIEIALVQLAVLSKLGLDYSEEFSAFMDMLGTARSITGEEINSLVRFANTHCDAEVYKTLIDRLDQIAHPEESAIAFAKAAYAEKLGDRYSEGLWLRSAVFSHPVRLLYLNKLAKYFVAIGEYRVAIRMTDLCSIADPSKKHLFSIAVVEYLLAEGAVMRAEQRMIEVLKEFPGNVRVMNATAQMFPDTHRDMFAKHLPKRKLAVD